MLRIATLEDLHELSTLYRDTISLVNIKDYNAAQVNAWAGRWTNIAGWTEKITQQHFIVEEIGGVIAGFSSLTTSGHLDMMFVHHKYQGQGIAKRLVNEIVAVATGRGYEQLTSDVSITARPFFERMGFTVITPQIVSIDDVELTNFKMVKPLM